jgi:hypothetical protein
MTEFRSNIYMNDYVEHPQNSRCKFQIDLETTQRYQKIADDLDCDEDNLVERIHRHPRFTKSIRTDSSPNIYHMT